ncbi:PHD finger protein EHD3 isoform X2 [Euphorbia lathyris]|uniref:PHD finger protein EHD3 isoform X2 n=1 Tax=Euphorbia lathyris TaxID=212925 RepID=UPI003313237C
MSGEEGTSKGVSPSEGIHCLKREATDNGFEIRNLTDSGECSSVLGVGVRTYKRRKYARSSSESKGQVQRGSMETASKLEDETIKEQSDCLPKKYASLDGSRTFVLECICRSLNNDDGVGIQGCIRDALKMEVQDPDTHAKDREKCSSQSQSIPNGTHYAAREHVVMSNESLDGTHRPVTTMCQRTFRLSLIHTRMRDGSYEHMPLLFYADIQLMWKKLQDIGKELNSIAKSLSDVSSAYYNEQFYNRKSYQNGKSEEIDPCRTYCVFSCQRCGGKADVRESLVCDSCEETYHVSCIEPAVKEIPPRTWYCTNCTARGMDSPHENCIVCARLNAPIIQCTQASAKGVSPANEKMFSDFEEASNCSRDDFCEASGGSRSVCCCKICGSEVENGEKVMICEHIDCTYKYYHMRCLTSNLLKSYGPRWYCPSCLCRVCLDDKDDDKIVLCDGCDHGYHMYCMNPPRMAVPRGKWFCVHCRVKLSKIGRAKRQYEKQGNNTKQEEKELHEKCVQELDNSREGMDILLTAALGHTYNSSPRF